MIDILIPISTSIFNPYSHVKAFDKAKRLTIAIYLHDEKVKSEDLLAVCLFQGA